MSALYPQVAGRLMSSGRTHRPTWAATTGRRLGTDERMGAATYVRGRPPDLTQS
ncbi:hypothetical protein [Nocardioides fonticola]|uniref:hypothetical protein n=1 Tax=Nocardioides fonticola TaxID=450363 RepID=UPI0031DCD7E9